MNFFGVIWFLVVSVLALLLMVIVIHVVRDFICYRNLDFYRKQGIKCYYQPVLGILSKFIRAKGDWDQLENFRRHFEENKNEPLVMWNTNKITGSTGFILDEALIRELMIKESEHCGKVEYMKHVNFGFFFENGQSIIEARAIYSRFFHSENMRKITLKTGEIVNRRVEQLRKAHQDQLEKGEWVKLDLKKFIFEVFGDIVNSALFGEEEPNLILEEDLPMAIQKYIAELFGINTNVASMLSLDYLHELKILPQTRACLAKYQIIEDKVWEIYNKRLQTGPKPQPNLLDLLIERNKELEKEGKPQLTKRDVAGHMVVLQFAGADSSSETITNSIMIMSKNNEIQKDFLGVVDKVCQGLTESQVPTYEQYEHNEDLEEFNLEFLRLGAPFSILSPREFIKPAKIGKYEFRVGDRLMIPCGLMHTMSRYFDNPSKCDRSRMSAQNKSKIKKSAYMPFGLGRRQCLGKAVGEMSVKINLVNFFRYFTVKPDPEYQDNKVIKIAYGYVDPTVYVHLRP